VKHEPLPAARPLSGWTKFWFTPADPLGLHVVRLLTGLLLLAWLLPLAGDVDSLFGLHGWFDRQAYAETARLPNGPPKPVSWSLLYLCGANPAALHVAFWASVGVLVLYTLGVGTRLTGVLVWLIVVSFTANPAFDDEADPLLLLLTFYVMIGYLLLEVRNGRLLGSWRTFPLGWSGRVRQAVPGPSLGANLALRLIQVHLAVIVVTSGLHKLQFGDWWAGVAYWFTLHPPLETTIAGVQAEARSSPNSLYLLNAAAYLTLFWQIGFPLFAWRRGWWRVLLLGGAVVGWIGTAVMYRMPLFGPAVLIGCLAYVSPEGWRTLGARLGGIATLLRRSSWAAGERQRPAISAPKTRQTGPHAPVRGR
jgi:hypothetical protein